MVVKEKIERYITISKMVKVLEEEKINSQGIIQICMRPIDRNLHQ